MNSLLHLVSLFKNVLQDQLFPVMHEALGPLSERQEQFVRALALLGLDRFVAVRHGRGTRIGVLAGLHPGRKLSKLLLKLCERILRFLQYCAAQAH